MKPERRERLNHRLFCLIERGVKGIQLIPEQKPRFRNRRKRRRYPVEHGFKNHRTWIKFVRRTGVVLGVRAKGRRGGIG